jgi:hypothetical protein
MTPNFINLLDMGFAPRDGREIVMLFVVESQWFLAEGFWDGDSWTGFDPITERYIQLIEPIKWAHKTDFIERIQGAGVPASDDLNQRDRTEGEND